MEADDHELDSTFGDGTSSTGGSTTTSIKSAITKYEFEHGRRYHAYKAGRYVFPNDEKELERMDIEHHNQGLQLGALHLAPIGRPQRILDVGTGTGVWAIDVADQYPSAIVVGIDLSPVQATWVPPNVKFEVSNNLLPSLQIGRTTNPLLG
jgi:ribosomal protein L11 methylase PrmA